MTNNSAGEVRSAAQASRVLSPIGVGVIGVAATRTRPCTAWTAMEDLPAALFDYGRAAQATLSQILAGWCEDYRT
ncbi:MAG: hypothetical protein WBO08_10310 [Mycobacterium sp.]|nr:hypothetical protein [Mycobacterium sp.]